MSKSLKVLALMLVVLAGVYALAADAPKDYGVGQTKMIELVEGAKVGTVTLPAGIYKVTHLVEGANHVMVFKDTNKNNKEVARVNCTMVDLPKKADQNSQEFATKGGERVLSGLTFKGETFKHQF